MNPVDPHGLLQAVLDEPDNDIHRLAYADWLAEIGHADRAELIQVQCELAVIADEHSDRYWDGQLGDGPSHYRHRKTLRRRSETLIRYNFTDWRMRDWTLSKETWNDPDDIDWTIDIEFNRGFVSTIRLTMADFLVDGVAGYLFSHHPIERVVITDCKPISLACDAGSEVSMWVCNKHEKESPWFVPRELWDLIDLPLVKIGGQTMPKGKYAITESTADNAISVACWRYGKGVPR